MTDTFEHAKQRFLSGLDLMQAGRFPDAEQAFSDANALVPNRVSVLTNLSVALLKQNKSLEARDIALQSVKIDPNNYQGWNNLGYCALNLNEPEAAMDAFQRALNIAPNYPAAVNGQGLVYKELKRFQEAQDLFKLAIQLDSNFADAYNNLGNTFADLGLMQDAEQAIRTALALDPHHADAHGNLGKVLALLGRIEDAIASYRCALEFRSWDPGLNSDLLFTLAYNVFLPPPQYLEEAKAWQRRVVSVQQAEQANKKAFQRAPLPTRRLRVGYVSGDFRQHPISFFIEPILRHHDRKRVETFAYTTNIEHDSTTELIRSLPDHWRSLVGVSAVAACQQIADDQIDVLIDLSGHTGFNRLDVFALRAAPVQAHYLGYYSSTGLSEMDYWIGDPVLLPPEDDATYCEKIWRLPRTWVSYKAPDDAPPTNWVPRSDGSICLGSFNNLNKITPASISLWATLLHRIPNAKILLKTKELDQPENVSRIQEAFGIHGIRPERLELLGSAPSWHEHMALYNLLDIALDPVGAVGGCTTTCDALWMGVPVVSLKGQTMAQRMTSSLLTSIQHPEWIASSADDYIQVATNLALNTEHRRSLRHSQRQIMSASPLCNAGHLAAALEDAYEAMLTGCAKT